MATIAQADVRVRTVRPPAREWLVPILLVGGLVVVYLLAQASGASMAAFWAVGLGVGFVLQRSRFCFTSAFRDLFLLGQGRMMRGILVGLIVATLGFGMIMATIIPAPSTGTMPSDAHILPLGPATIVGGLLFGFGMVIAGGCVSGALYRMGEGYVGSWVAMGGVMIGLYGLNRTWLNLKRRLPSRTSSSRARSPLPRLSHPEESSERATAPALVLGLSRREPPPTADAIRDRCCDRHRRRRPVYLPRDLGFG